jgi:hypothetical protein
LETTISDLLRELKTTSRVNPASSVLFEMQFDVVDLLVLSVGHVEDDKDVISVRAAFSKLLNWKRPFRMQHSLFLQQLGCVTYISDEELWTQNS